MAGFEVIIYGRFSGAHRGVDGVQQVRVNLGVGIGILFQLF
jgi:hypothetical protein